MLVDDRCTCISIISGFSVGLCRSSDGPYRGHFLSAVGAAVITSQVLVLPGVLRISKGRESLVVQGAMMVHAFKFIGYAWAPSGKWVYVVLALSTPTFCAAPVLSSLCTRHVPATQQGLWSGSMSALNTAANVVGALIGSRLLALSLRGFLPLGSPLYAGALCHMLAALCVGCASLSVDKKTSESYDEERAPESLHGA
ncbi:tetA [Symbiodinium sp. CCMP2456]|nr:tetA [Symbiodinium sp. CCMP2456]